MVDLFVEYLEIFMDCAYIVYNFAFNKTRTAMRIKSIISLLIACMVFGHPALSMNSRDNDEQTKTYTVPITIIKRTSILHRGNNIAPISAYYQSGYVVLDFFETCECAIITILNASTNACVDYIVDICDNSVFVDMSDICLNYTGEFEINILTESGEIYWGEFTL